jgi:hypothetical protein
MSQLYEMDDLLIDFIANLIVIPAKPDTVVSTPERSVRRGDWKRL